MGVSLSWVAPEQLPAADALSRLALVGTGKVCVYPFKGLATKALPNNWTLVVAGRCDHRITRANSMSNLSSGCRAVACTIEEHVGFAAVELWQNGHRLWRVQHQGEDGPENMTIEGSPPEQFEALLAGVEPNDSDRLDGYFHMDVPLLLARDLAGFKHDEVDAEIDVVPFEELCELASSRPWWKRWR